MLVLAFRAKVQLEFALPAHGPPVHPENCPVEVVAVTVTTVPAGKLAAHVVPQLMPAGLLVMVPVPCPFCTLVTVRVNVPVGGGGGGVDGLNVAVTVVFAFSCVVQGPVPEQPPPLHPPKTDPEAGVAVNVTVVPVEKDLEQVVPQLIPVGLLVTVPEPVPDFKTCRVFVPPLPLPLSSGSAEPPPRGSVGSC